MLARVLIALLAPVVLLCSAATAPAAVPHGDDFSGERAVAVRAPALPRTATRAARRTVGPGPRSTAVLLINFANDASQPWTPAVAEQRVFTDADSTNAFFSEESHGQVSLTGDVFGWYTIAAANTGCDINAMLSQGTAAAAADGVNVNAYQHVVLVFPPTGQCEWSGLGTVPGPYSWINGTLDPQVIAHELGHNMGVHHAAAYACYSGAQPVTISGDCDVWEYGDPFSVMGAYDLRHNHAYHLRQLGFLPASKVQTVTESGTYSLGSAADPAASPVALRIPRVGGEYYYLDLRTAWGVFDDFSPTDPIMNGVSIRIAPDPTDIRQTYLLDTTPGTSASPNGFADGALTLGETFDEGDVSITTVAVEDGEATIAVVMPSSPDTSPPSNPTGLSATPVDGGLDLSWTASSDNVGVTGYQVWRGGTLLTTTPQTTFRDESVTAGGTYTYAVLARDEAGNVSAAAQVTASVPSPPVEPPATSAPAPPAPAPVPAPVVPAGVAMPAFVRPAPLTDATRPRLTVRARRRGRKVTVTVKATDDNAVTHLELWVDGRRRRTATSGRLAWTGTLRRLARRHTVVVKAFDAAGNEARARTRVR
jgi:hypothetical protein